MKYPEERHAKDLHRDLTRRFVDSNPVTTVTIEGGGVNWCCAVRRGPNLCSTACFDIPGAGAEYLTSFDRDSTNVATGRTYLKQDTINAIDDWLQGQQLSRLYDRFQFIDQMKRTLASIRDDMTARVSELSEIAPAELRQDMCDIYELWFRGLDRSCQISFCGKNEVLDAAFYWDDCELFRFRAKDRSRLASILKSWVCDRTMPSSLRIEYPEIAIGKLADYYERGNPIEGEFVQSWNSIECFYNDLDYQFVPKVRDLITKVRQKGYDKTLRAGQSMWSLIVSRSRRHGLRSDQPMIAFWFHKDGMDVHIKLDEQATLKCAEIQFTQEIDTVLKKLEAMAIE